MRSRRTIPFALAALSYAIAFAQRPGAVVADTKVHLYLEPGRFLRDVLSLWASSPDLGHVWASQYGGYAWPMAPWFALGDAAGLPVWVVHRLWLGTILALAAWGVVRLLDVLMTRRRGAAHLAAAALYVVNPYVTVYADRASVTLLAYATLPWLLLAAHQGLRDPRGWRWPAFFALVLATAGGGVNAATTAWVMVGPALLVVYELWLGEVRLRALRSLLVRLVPVAVIVNVWWLIPLLVAGRGAPNFLAFTEQPGTIWSTTSLSESLRLMGFWTSYVGVGYTGDLRPYQGSATAMLGLLPVVLAGLALPALSLGSYTWTRRWRYAPLFLLMVLVGALVMVVGWPEGTPLRKVVTGAYYRAESLQPLRTTYKAGALVALGLAVLGGAGVAAALRRWPRGPVWAGVAAVAALAAWPLVTGRAIERQLEIDVPPTWRQAAADLDKRPDATRAMVLPGQLFASYRWGGAIDAVLPPLTDHPVTTRWIVPFADLRSTELQFTVDALINQERLRPGQLRPLLDVMGVGDVLIAADGDRALSGEMPAAAAARELAGAGGLGPVTAGAVRGAQPVRAQPAAGRAEAPVTVPALRRVEVRTGGIVRVLPRAGLTVVDGAAGALAGLASYGALDPSKAYTYAPDVTGAASRGAAAGPGALRRAAADGASFVIADGNRRRAFVAPRLKGATGPTLPRDEGVSVDGTILDPFGDLDQRAQTTAEVAGVRAVTAPSSPQVTQFPDRRPFAALDGDPATAWIADRALVPARHTLTVELGSARDVDTLRLLPYSDSRGVVKAVTVNGRRFAVRRGWNTLRVGLRGISSLAIHMASVTKPVEAEGGGGGIRELEIPGVHATETLRPPTDIEDALRGSDLWHNALTYIFDRTTADSPAVQQKVVGERGAADIRDAQDPEPALRRAIRPPAARSYAVTGWGSVSARAPDAVYAGLSGSEAEARLASSSRFEGLGRFRASGAFDGAGGRSWVGQWVPGHAAWLSWTAPRAVTVRTLRLEAPGVRVRRPTRVKLTVDGVAGREVAVGPGGAVALPAPLRGRSFRLDVVDARWPAGTPGRIRQRRAVGIGEIRGAGIPPVRVPRGGTVALPCGAATVTVAGRPYGLRATVDRAALDAGRPIRLQGCGPLAVAAKNTVLVGGDGVPREGSEAGRGALRVDGLRLAGAAPAGAAAGARAPVSAGRVLDPGEDRRGGRDGVRVQVDAPSWLVLGQSYDRAWRATCDGRDLGEPRALQGFANGWPVERGCRDVSFSYGPQKLADAGYAISLAGGAGLLGLLGVGAWRRRRTAPAPPDDPAELPPAPPPGRLRASAALAVALPASVVIAGVFGLRGGAVALPVLALLLWRGVDDRALGLAALGLLGLVVPAIYAGVAIFNDEGLAGGNATRYPPDRLGAHWAAVAAFVMLCIVLWRSLAVIRAARRPAPDGRDPIPSKP